MRKLRIIIPVLCFLLVILLFRCVIYIGYVTSESMEPTIPAGSKILGLRIFGELKPGDIIVFEYDGKNMVKRIAACPGDTLQSDVGESLTVPEDCYYVLGDNPDNSYDSRYWTEPFVHRNKIKARIILR